MQLPLSYCICSSIPKSRAPFQDAYVFVVGGGNYVEYQNLQDYCTRQPLQNKRNITYGTTELMNAAEFLAQVCIKFKDILALVVTG